MSEANRTAERPEVSGDRDLNALLADLRPSLVRGEFVFVVITDAESMPPVHPYASVVEPEGLSLVLRREQADELSLSYDFVAAWITLRVNSSLQAVGLTAEVSRTLAHAGVSCNVIAGFHHDHLLVPHDKADHVLDFLHDLSVRTRHAMTDGPGKGNTDS